MIVFMPVDQPPAIEHPAPRLYASADTRLRLGFLASRLPGWAGRDVIVVSRADVEPLIERSTIEQHVDLNTQEMFPFLSQIFNQVTAKFGYPYHPVRVRNGQDVGMAIDVHSADAVLSASRGAGAAVAINSNDVMATTSNLCVIGMPDTSTVSKTLEIWTGLKSDQVHFTLNARDILNFTFAHETGHCGQYEPIAKPYADPLKNEIEADQHAMNVLPALYPARLAPGKLQQLVDMRAIEIFHGNDADHATTAALNIAGGRPDYAPFVQDMLVSSPVLADAKFMRRHPEAIEHAAVNDLGFYHVLNKATDFISDIFGSDKAESTRRLKTDPALMYETIKNLRRDGVFAKSDLETKYVDQYLHAMDAHATPDALDEVSRPAPKRSSPLPPPPGIKSPAF